jgi:tripeptide aminopeptidase
MKNASCAIAGILVAALSVGPARGQSPDERIRRIRQAPSYDRAMELLDRDYERFVDELIDLTEIPAPPFQEQERAIRFLAMLQDLGLQDVEMDAAGNVMGLRPGDGESLLVVAAHLDTVFPEGTDVTVRRSGTRLMAPGVGDDTSGLATLLAVARALDAADIRTTSDILFVGDVGEEGIGDLRGVKYLFREGPYRGRIDMFVSVEGGRQADITNAALGSRRYRVTFRGPGGHSYSVFGLVNPAFAMAKAIDLLSRVEVPEYPKTTFNVGVLGGGTSVNSIPAEAWMEVDLRSEENDLLEELASRFLEVLDTAVEEENSVRSTGQGRIELDVELIGERPSGEITLDAPIVQNAAAAYRSFGIEPSYSRSSTDSNIPISMGIPAITIDRGGLSGRSHSLDEWVDVDQTSTVRGLRVVLTTVLAVAGMEEPPQTVR